NCAISSFVGNKDSSIKTRGSAPTRNCLLGFAEAYPPTASVAAAPPTCFSSTPVTAFRSSEPYEESSHDSSSTKRSAFFASRTLEARLSEDGLLIGNGLEQL